MLQTVLPHPWTLPPPRGPGGCGRSQAPAWGSSPPSCLRYRADLLRPVPVTLTGKGQRPVCPGWSILTRSSRVDGVGGEGGLRTRELEHGPGTGPEGPPQASGGTACLQGFRCPVAHSQQKPLLQRKGGRKGEGAEPQAAQLSNFAARENEGGDRTKLSRPSWTGNQAREEQGRTIFCVVEPEELGSTPNSASHLCPAAWPSR